MLHWNRGNLPTYKKVEGEIALQSLTQKSALSTIETLQLFSGCLCSETSDELQLSGCVPHLTNEKSKGNNFYLRGAKIISRLDHMSLESVELTVVAADQPNVSYEVA